MTSLVTWNMVGTQVLHGGVPDNVLSHNVTGLLKLPMISQRELFKDNVHTSFHTYKKLKKYFTEVLYYHSVSST